MAIGVKAAKLSSRNLKLLITLGTIHMTSTPIKALSYAITGDHSGVSPINGLGPNSRRMRELAEANRISARRGSGTYRPVDIEAVSEQMYAQMQEAKKNKKPLSLTTELSKSAAEIRSMLVELQMNIAKYGDDDHAEIEEILSALDRTRSALLDLPKAARDRKLASMGA